VVFSAVSITKIKTSLQPRRYCKSSSCTDLSQADFC
jgi:hypothetical protein